MLGDETPRRDRLIEYLHTLQDTLGHLPERLLAALAQELRISLAEVAEVALFYHHFDVVHEGEAAPPQLTVRVCDSLACAMHGASQLAERLPALLGTTVRVQRVPCVGRCDRAPVVVVGQHPVETATEEAVLAKVGAGETACPVPDAAASAGYPVFAACRRGERTPEHVIATLEHAGLRGLGGAGFPVGHKWRLVAAQPGPRYLTINIDEGEPGTFKDRYYLERNPYAFLEGALIAAWAVGIEAIWIYLRDEYAGCRALLAAALDELRAAIPDAPAIELRRGAGAYVCGEESAMVESIEGKRGMPRLRPPYLAEIGLFGRPTLEHNMESLHWVPEILEPRPRVVRRAGPSRAQGAALLLGLRPRRKTRRTPGAGRHHAQRADRGILRWHVPRPHALRLLPRRRLGRHPARQPGRHTARLRHPAALRLLHRLRRHRGLLAGRPGARPGAKRDGLLRPRILRTMHALPSRHERRRRN
jgi:NADH:ubiquinone oxidoreductase subunit E